MGAGVESSYVGDHHLGEPASVPLDTDRGTLDYRRIFVSNPDIAGRRLRDLNLPGRFGVRIEDVVVLQEGGCQDITLAKKDLLIL